MLIMLLILFNKARDEGFHRKFDDNESSDSSGDGDTKGKPRWVHSRKVSKFFSLEESDEWTTDTSADATDFADYN